MLILKIIITFFDVLILNGAQTRNRTTDTGIFSPLLYRLSYLGKWRKWRDSNSRHLAWQASTLTNWATPPKKWWSQLGSNQWPPACKAGALPTELCDHLISYYSISISYFKKICNTFFIFFVKFYYKSIKYRF